MFLLVFAEDLLHDGPVENWDVSIHNADYYFCCNLTNIIIETITLLLSRDIVLIKYASTPNNYLFIYVI